MSNDESLAPLEPSATTLGPQGFRRSLSIWTPLVIAGMFGAVISVPLNRVLNPPIALASVNVQQLLREHVEAQGKHELDDAARMQAVEAFAHALDAVIDQTMRDSGVVLLASPAVVRGAPDLTAVVRQQIQQRLEEQP